MDEQSETDKLKEELKALEEGLESVKWAIARKKDEIRMAEQSTSRPVFAGE